VTAREIEEKGSLLESVCPPFLVDPALFGDEHDYRLSVLLAGVVAIVEPPGLYSIGLGHAARSEGRQAAARRAGAVLACFSVAVVI
jgi:hypothetical protein